MPTCKLFRVRKASGRLPRDKYPWSDDEFDWGMVDFFIELGGWAEAGVGVGVVGQTSRRVISRPSAAMLHLAG